MKEHGFMNERNRNLAIAGLVILHVLILAGVLSSIEFSPIQFLLKLHGM
jgi:hypothetical protein